MQKKRSRFKSKRQYKDEAIRKQEAEALARQIQRRLDRLVPDKEVKAKTFEEYKPKAVWRPEPQNIKSKRNGVEPVRKHAKTVKYEGEMAQRESAAQEEVEAKKKRIAPLYNKGAYMLITEGTDPKDIGRKNPL